MKSKLLLRTAAALCALSAIAYAVAPPANTQIGNSATATYTDATNTSRTTTSNTVVTVVQQVSSFALTADQSKFAAPGGQVYYPHTIVNTGNGTDTFTIGATNNAAGDNFDLTNLALFADANGDGLPDNATPITTTGPVIGGATYKFVAVGIVPGSALTTQTAVISVTAIGTATGTPAAQQTNTDTTTVTNNAVVSVTKSVSSSSGGPGSGPHTFTLTYTNTGNTTATNATITDVIPAGMTYVAASGRWSVTGNTPLTDANDGTQGTAPDTIAYDFGITVAGRATAVVARILPGETRTVSFQINIAAAQAAGTIQNTANYTYDPGTGTPVGPVPTNTVNFTVVQSTGVTVGDATVATATQGGTAVFTNLVTNTGNGTDRFNITIANTSFPAGTTFQFFKPDANTPLVDTNNDGIPDTGNMLTGGTFNLVVKAILPPSASGTNVNYTAVVTGTSITNPATSDPGNDILTSVTANTVDLTANAALPGGLGIGAGPEVGAVVTNTTNPGSTTRFTLFVNNTSAITDTFNLAASTDSTFAGLTLPAGWSVVFRDASNAIITNTGVIIAGANKQVFADVVVPAGQTVVTTDLFFRAQSPTSGATDRLHDAVTVNAVRSLGLSPNNSGQVAPNGSIVYTHTLVNNGNVVEGAGTGSSIALTTANNAAGWSSVVYFDANGNGIIDATDPIVTDTTFVSNGAAGLAPNESVTLLVKVTAPPGAAINSQDATTLSATTTNGTYITTVPPVVTATDTSTVINGDVALVKEQALDSGAVGAPTGNPVLPYTSGQISSGAVPGKALRYRITVTNKGTAPATAIQVFDSTPAFTIYTTTGPATVTGGSAPSVVTVPANGAGGALQFNVGTLNPAESAVITFGVVITQ